jgi:hypothetical protein
MGRLQGIDARLRHRLDDEDATHEASLAE